VIDASGLNVDQQVDVAALDENDNPVAGVEVTPERVQVRMDVAQQLAYETVPVVPQLTGQPAPGYRVSSVSVAPPSVTVSGEAPAVQRLSSVATEPVDLGARSEAFAAEVGLAIPPDLTLIGAPDARVSVTLEPIQVSRTLEAGVILQGARSDRAYELSVPSVNVTVAGDQARVDAIVPPELRARAPVGGLGVGTHEVTLNVVAPAGVTVVAVRPSTISVRVSNPARTPAPPASPAPGAS
jgi:YbbR domain-containing protein